MVTVGERNFHLLMAGLLLASTVLDSAMRRLLPAWNPPQVGFVTLALGLVWIALFAAYRIRRLDEALRVAEARIERLERREAERID